MTIKSPKPRTSRTAPTSKSASAPKAVVPRAKSPKVTLKQPAATAAVPQPTSKQSQLINLLRSAAGSSMATMTHLTGWQPHTVRATISATLRKKLGHNVVCAANPAGERIYRIAPHAKKA